MPSWGSLLHDWRTHLWKQYMRTQCAPTLSLLLFSHCKPCWSELHGLSRRPCLCDRNADMTNPPTPPSQTFVSDHKVIVMTGTEVRSISSHSVCKIPVISAAHTPSWAYCTCQITSVHLSSVFLCSCSLSFFLPRLGRSPLSISGFDFHHSNRRKVYNFHTVLYAVVQKTGLLKYLRYTSCLLFPVHTLLYTSSRGFQWTK